MVSVKAVEYNDAWFRDTLDGGNGVEEALDKEAQRILTAATAAAPVATGAYRASLHIETDHTDRMRKRVVADVAYALIVEAETGNLAKAI